MKWKKRDYLKILPVPVALLIVYNIIVYLVVFFTYGDITAYEQAASVAMWSLIFSIPLMILYQLIFFYSGWITVSKFNGTVLQALFSGLIISAISILSSFIQTFLTYSTIPGYRIATIPPGIGNIGIIGTIIGMLIGIPFALLINSGIAALGGFIAKKVNKTK